MESNFRWNINLVEFMFNMFVVVSWNKLNCKLLYIYTYFDSFQWGASENQIVDRRGSGTAADRTQSGIAVVALEAKALFLIVIFCPAPSDIVMNLKINDENWGWYIWLNKAFVFPSQ